MYKKDLQFMKDIYENLKKVPAVGMGLGSPTTSAGVFVRAYEDYKTAHELALMAMNCKISAEEWRMALKSPEADTEYINSEIKANEEQSQEKLNELKAFISKRESAKWI